MRFPPKEHKEILHFLWMLITASVLAMLGYFFRSIKRYEIAVSSDALGLIIQQAMNAKRQAERCHEIQAIKKNIPTIPLPATAEKTGFNFNTFIKKNILSGCALTWQLALVGFDFFLATHQDKEEKGPCHALEILSYSATLLAWIFIYLDTTAKKHHFEQEKKQLTKAIAAQQSALHNASTSANASSTVFAAEPLNIVKSTSDPQQNKLESLSYRKH